MQVSEGGMVLPALLAKSLALLDLPAAGEGG